jgi:cob(I)alamin adenosyltransferase
MTPLYTSKGDSGDTGYLGSGRISKASTRIEAVGAVDEATAALGLARSLTESEKCRKILLNVQKKLYWLMSELSAAPDVAKKFDKINENDVRELEAEIAELEVLVELPREFIIPGEAPASAALAVARTVVRRAERRTIALLEEKEIQKQVLAAFLNRLSSLVFILEVYESSLSGDKPRLVKGN